jgi:hypothetical protein
VLGTAGESHFHTYSSAKAFRRNFAASSVPGPAWATVGGATQPVFNKSGHVDGADEYTWSSSAEIFVQALAPPRDSDPQKLLLGPKDILCIQNLYGKFSWVPR